MWSIVILAAGCVTSSDPGEIVIVSSHESRPDWTFTPSAAGEEHKYRYFVGVSRYQTSEQEARNQARKDVRQKIKDYLKGKIPSEQQLDLSPADLSGSYRVKDIYIQKVFRVKGHHWKVYVLAAFPKKLLDELKNTSVPTVKEKDIQDSKTRQTLKNAKRLQWQKNIGPVTTSSPAIDDKGNIYVGSKNSFIYSLTPGGKVRWKYKTGDQVYSAPTIGKDGTVYVGSDDGYLYALTPDGDLKWKLEVGKVYRASPAIGTSGTLYIGSSARKLYAISPSGKIKWEFNTSGVVRSPPVIGPGGTIYFGDALGFEGDTYPHYGAAGNLYALSPEGKLRWKYDVNQGIDASPALGKNGTIYVGTYEYDPGRGHFYAISSQGKLKWKYNVGNRMHASPVVGKKGTVYAGVNVSYGSAEKNVFAFTPGGEVKWKFKAGRRLNSGFTLGNNGTLYFGCWAGIKGGYLYALNPDGSQKWRYNVGKVSNIPAISSDGTLYIGSKVGGKGSGIYAFKTSTTGLADSSWPTFQYDSKNSGFWPRNMAEKSRVLWKNNYGPRAGATALSPDGQTIYASSHYSEGDLYAFDRSGNRKWKKQLPGIYGGWPTVGPDGTLYYVKNTDAGDEWTIYAFSPEGKKLWEYADNCVFKRNLAVGPDGTLYVGSMKGRMGERMYALSPEGRLKWKKQLGSRLVAAPVVGKDGTIYQTGYNKNSNRSTLYALAPDGSVKWTYRAEGARLRNLSLDGDGNLLASDLSGGLHAVSPTGKRLWTASTEERLQAAPVVGPDRTIYAAAHGNELFAFTPEGNKKWSRKLPGNSGQYEVRSTPVVDSEGYIYVTNYRSREAGFLAAITPRGKLDWKLELNGGGHQSGNLLLIKDGTILATTHTGSLYAVQNSTGKGLADSPWPAYQQNNQNTGRELSSAAVSSQQGESGKVKWKFELPASLPHPAALAPDGRTLYVRSGFGDGDLFAINSDGSQKWQVELEGYRNGSVPAVGADGIIYVGGAESGKFYAVNPDGSIRWQTDIGGRIRGSPALGPDGTVYVSSDKFYALSPTGETKWVFPGQGSFTTAAALGTDGTIYVGDENYLWALTPGGDVKWSFRGDFDKTYSSPAIGADGTVYVADSSGVLYALDRDGALKWNFNTGSKRGRQRQNISVGSGETIYVGTSTGDVFALDRSGNRKWKFSATDPKLHVTSVPTHAADGTIYVNMIGPNSDPESKIFALSPEGKVKWTVTNDGRFTGDPAIGPDGTLYVGSGYRSSTPGLWAIHTSGATLGETPWPRFQFDNQSTGRQNLPRSGE